MTISSDFSDEVGPVRDCDSCMSPSVMKIGGLCLLHHAAKNHTLSEFRTARREVKEQLNVFDLTQESKQRFRERAREVFPDRFIQIRHPSEAIVDGQNIAWVSGNRNSGDTFHADKDCPNFPNGSLKAYPMEHARDHKWIHRCPRCTTEETND